MKIENIKKINFAVWFGWFYYGVLWIWSPVQVGKAKGQDEGREGFHIWYWLSKIDDIDGHKYMIFIIWNTKSIHYHSVFFVFGTILRWNRKKIQLNLSHYHSANDIIRDGPYNINFKLLCYFNQKPRGQRRCVIMLVKFIEQSKRFYDFAYND